MDLWSYLRALLRWWWLLVLVPLIAFVIAYFILFPAAPWQSTWKTVITFEGNPAKANSFEFVDFIVLDDLEHLLQSDVLGDQVYMQLPDEITSRYSREDIGHMYSSYRHARFVQIWVTGDEPEVVDAVARATEAVLPEAVNEYLIPPDNPDFPGMVETMDRLSEPVQLRMDRWQKIAAMTGVGVITALCLVGIVEWLSMSYRAKYGAR
jgi:capsular polysaccharide biosynthesis protein